MEEHLLLVLHSPHKHHDRAYEAHRAAGHPRPPPRAHLRLPAPTAVRDDHDDGREEADHQGYADEQDRAVGGLLRHEPAVTRLVTEGSNPVQTEDAVELVPEGGLFLLVLLGRRGVGGVVSLRGWSGPSVDDLQVVRGLDVEGLDRGDVAAGARLRVRVLNADGGDVGVCRDDVVGCNGWFREGPVFGSELEGRVVCVRSAVAAGDVEGFAGWEGVGLGPAVLELHHSLGESIHAGVDFGGSRRDLRAGGLVRVGGL